MLPRDYVIYRDGDSVSIKEYPPILYGIDLSISSETPSIIRGNCNGRDVSHVWGL